MNTPTIASTAQPACPVCGTPCTAPPLHEYTVKQAASHFCPPSRNPALHDRFIPCIRRLWNGETTAVHRCPQCKFGFGWPYVGGDEEFYTLMHEMAGYPAWRWDYDVTIQHVLPQYSGGRILDIGTGSGNFLKGLGPQWEKLATEGSETTRARLRADGITCFADNADALRQARGTFAIVTMFQVLEHISAFESMLNDCYALLQPGGALVIGVPFADATFIQEQTTGYPDMLPNHINKWTPRALELAMRRTGFEPQKPFLQPGSLKLLAYRAWLRVRSHASTRPRSLAAMTYRIGNRRLRFPLIAMLTLFSLVRCLPRAGQMRIGHSFVMVGRKATTVPPR